MQWYWLLAIAVASDLLDYLGAAVPLLGDVLDLATTAVLLPLLGPVAASGLVELVPGADPLPTYTLATLWFLWRRRRERGALTGMDVAVGGG